MKITITPPNGGTPFTLGDDSVAAVSGSVFPNGCGGLVKGGLLPELSLATQGDDLIRAKYRQELPKGNAQQSYSFEVFRDFATSDQALLFLRDHQALVPPVGTLAVTVGVSTAYLANAVLTGIRCGEHTGTAVGMSYTYKGSYVPPGAGAAGAGTGGPWQAQPPTRSNN